jgi:hypothetical protein
VGASSVEEAVFLWDEETEGEGATFTGTKEDVVGAASVEESEGDGVGETLAASEEVGAEEEVAGFALQ